MEELNETLKVVERELNFAKKAYNSILYLYWAAAFPLIYLLSTVISSMTEISMNSLMILFSAGAIILFIVEEFKAAKKVRQIETALGREMKVNKAYLLAQFIVWPILIVTVGILTDRTWPFPIVAIGAGMVSLAAVDFVFRKRWQENALIGTMILLFSVPYHRVPLAEGGYTTLVLSMAFALGAYLTLRKAMRE